MSELPWIVSSMDESPDTLNELERWLRDDGLGARISRTYLNLPTPGVGSQGALLEGLEALLNTGGVAALIRAVSSFAAAVYKRKPQGAPEFVLKHSGMTLTVKGNMSEAQIDSLIRIAEAAFNK